MHVPRQGGAARAGGSRTAYLNFILIRSERGRTPDIRTSAGHGRARLTARCGSARERPAPGAQRTERAGHGCSGSETIAQAFPECQGRSAGRVADRPTRRLTSAPMSGKTSEPGMNQRRGDHQQATGRASAASLKSVSSGLRSVTGLLASRGLLEFLRGASRATPRPTLCRRGGARPRRGAPWLAAGNSARSALILPLAVPDNGRTRRQVDRATARTKIECAATSDAFPIGKIAGGPVGERTDAGAQLLVFSFRPGLLVMNRLPASAFATRPAVRFQGRRSLRTSMLRPVTAGPRFRSQRLVRSKKLRQRRRLVECGALGR